MGVLNNAAIADVRKVLSGKDGGFYDGDGNLLASTETFKSQVAINNLSYQPLGDAQEHGAMGSFKVTLTVSEIVVESSLFFEQLIEGMKNHKMPEWNYRGMTRSPYNDSEEQVVYRACVPDGTIDIQNMVVGELYKRSWSFIVNEPPELMKKLLNS